MYRSRCPSALDGDKFALLPDADHDFLGVGKTSVYLFHTAFELFQGSLP